MRAASLTSWPLAPAGLRGTMGVGLYRMNVHVVRHATQAFAQVILEEGPQGRRPGRGRVLRLPEQPRHLCQGGRLCHAGNGIPVRLFESLRPHP